MAKNGPPNITIKITTILFIPSTPLQFGKICKAVSRDKIPHRIVIITWLPSNPTRPPVFEKLAHF